MELHTIHRWIGARPSVKSTRTILSSSVTCLALMSYCTFWCHNFDRSAYGIIESSDFIVDFIVFPSHQITRVAGRYLPVGVYISTSLPQWDCGQMHSGHEEILVILFAAFLWVNFRGKSFQYMSITSETYPWELPCWFWLQFAPNLVERCIKMAFMASVDKCTGHHHDIEVVASLSFNMLKLVVGKSRWEEVVYLARTCGVCSDSIQVFIYWFKWIWSCWREPFAMWWCNIVIGTQGLYSGLTI